MWNVNTERLRAILYPWRYCATTAKCNVHCVSVQKWVAEVYEHRVIKVWRFGTKHRNANPAMCRPSSPVNRLHQRQAVVDNWKFESWKLKIVPPLYKLFVSKTTSFGIEIRFLGTPSWGKTGNLPLDMLSCSWLTFFTLWTLWGGSEKKTWKD